MSADIRIRTFVKLKHKPALSRTLRIQVSCSESAVLVDPLKSQGNDRFRDFSGNAARNLPRMRANAASAIAAPAKGWFVRTPVVRSGRSECRLLDTQASIRQSRLAWRSGPVPIKTSHQRAQPRRLRVSLFASIAVEPTSTAAHSIFSKYLK